MNVEVLMSAMHQTDFEIGHRSHIQSDLLIINQCDRDDYQEITVSGHTWRMISTTERGLSKSRNMALAHARGEICLFADDDEVVADGYVEIINKAYGELPDAGAIVFNIDRIHNTLKKTYYKITQIKKAPLYRAYGSPMLSIVRAPIQAHALHFNEKFGSGTEWGGGEDSLFERDLRKCGIHMYEYPATIATIDYGNNSNWFHGYTEKYFYNLGAFTRYSKKNPFVRWLWKMYLCCYKLRKDRRLGTFEKLKWMRLGEKGIKNNVTYSEFMERRESNRR